MSDEQEPLKPSTKSQAVISGRAVAMVSKYTSFNPDCPEKTDACDFVFIAEDKDDDYSSWARDGYCVIGAADITVHVAPREETTRNAVAMLRAEQQKVRAEAEATATRLEQRIQSMLALTNEVAA